jgi:hypothetical protein
MVLNSDGTLTLDASKSMVVLAELKRRFEAILDAEVRFASWLSRAGLTTHACVCRINAMVQPWKPLVGGDIKSPPQFYPGESTGERRKSYRNDENEQIKGFG